jgi:long-subunit acyl-CoA synthetase (AMP-forming)
MSPTNIENTLSAECSLIGSAMVIGDGRRFNTALITVDAEAAVAFARARRLEALDGAALAAHPDVQESIAAGVERANARLSRVEQIKRYTVIPAAWEPGGDELTPTMKLKRKPIAEKYADMIEAMYVD